VPTIRSSRTIVRLAAKNCVKKVAIHAAENTDHTKIGTRPQLMPGARILIVVTMKLMPPRMDDRPNVMIDRLNMIWPAAFLTDSGG
jgi:hypothetical protein